MLVTVITPSNASIFPEYIFPNIQGLVQDPEVSVRAIYAQCVVPLATTAVRYLEMGQALKAHGTFKLSEDTVEYDEAQLLEVYSYSRVLQRALNVMFDRCPTMLLYRTFRRQYKSILQPCLSIHLVLFGARCSTTFPRCASSSAVNPRTMYCLAT